MIETEALNTLRVAINQYCIQEGRFPISDGNFVSSWIDLYPLTCSRKMMSKLTNALSTKLFTRPWKFEFIAGKELHGTLLASSLINKCSWLDSDLVIVRKEDNIVKTPYRLYNTDFVIEEHIKYEMNRTDKLTQPPRVPFDCILVDEVISSGVNMESSIEYLLNKGFRVNGVLSVVYRGGGAKEKAESRGIPFDYLYEIPEELICP